MIDKDKMIAEAKAAGYHNLAWDNGQLRVETAHFNGHEPDWFHWDQAASPQNILVESKDELTGKKTAVISRVFEV